MEIGISVDQSAAAGRLELENVLKSRHFSNAERLRRFLRFVAESTLDGKGDLLNEHLIGFEVFDKPQSYDPGKDPIVRVTARRVRLRLEEYYSSEGVGRPASHFPFQRLVCRHVRTRRYGARHRRHRLKCGGSIRLRRLRARFSRGLGS